MRYESRPYKSLSYMLREGGAEVQGNKENQHLNKENHNNLNQMVNKPTRNIHQSPLKLAHRASQSTQASGVTTSLPQALKQTYSQLIQEDYSDDILRRLCQVVKPRSGILSRHGITASLRSKMVDWMIEVLSSYKMSEETFFRSVHLMDGYLSECGRLEIKDLHLVGVTSMFAAGKYEEIHPLKLGIIYDKIARKKFKKSDILNKESEMVSVLDFKLEVPSVYDIARHLLRMNNHM